MNPVAIRSRPMRATTQSGCCALLLTAAFIITAALPAAAQPAEVDWRSALILRFEPASTAPDHIDPTPGPPNRARDPDSRDAAPSSRDSQETDRASQQSGRTSQQSGRTSQQANRGSDDVTGVSERINRASDRAVGSTGATDADSYLSNIAEGLASGLITESGGHVIAVGPLFGTGGGIGGAIEQPVIDPSLGTSDDWRRLMSEAERANVVIALHVKLPRSSHACAGLAKWVGTLGVQHLFVEDSGGCDLAALRTALDAAGSGTSWIARVRGGERGVAGTVNPDAAYGGGDEPDDVGAHTTDAEGGQIESDGPLDGAAHPGPTRFDAVVESVSLEALNDDGGLAEFYRNLAQRVDEEPEPLVADVMVSPDSIRLATRALMLPGAVQITAPAPLSGASDLWRSIAAFRSRHPAVSRGEHVELVNNAFAFARTSTERGRNDSVVVVLGASGNTTLNVSRIFPDNAMLRDALTGRTAFVSFGMATFEAGPSGIILVEEAYSSR